ncbi:MAG: hypothetical protein HETSPECPRED_008537 [Heterodermia speciosa]|uniref:AB hydrolase-1 domain-containing protein n=1 Tax=Heterodermia speciosa TaxID=116794 RepID=A0A8H3FYQ0_9LECA|nr:MAG: hypothetical protein HETSPECPRED_008537 [Heterodermia speciosa]
MLSLPIATLAVLAMTAAAKKCLNVTVPVDIAARTAVFDLPVPQSNADATAFVSNLTQQGRNFTDLVLTGYQNTAGKYQISTQYCVPSVNNVSHPTLQILTHGIGFDKTYWDNAYNNFNYSYVDVATDQYKYSTLSYDRLGIGNSSHGEPLNEIQSYLEVAALAKLTLMLRNGSFPGVPTAFRTITHVGHSFGSAQTYSLVNTYPNISDGIVLTGFSMNGSFIPYFEAGADFIQANLNQPFRFGNASFAVGDAILASVSTALNISTTSVAATNIINNYGLTDFVAGLPTRQRVPYVNGYLANSNANSNQYLFFEPGFFDPQLAFAGEATKQPVAVGELLTLGSAPMVNNYAGPVLVITGSSDLPFCGGDCFATGDPTLPSIPAAVAASFPRVRAEDFTAYIQPNTGHGLNFHYNQTGAYRVINDFLGSKGLAPS